MLDSIASTAVVRQPLLCPTYNHEYGAPVPLTAEEKAERAELARVRKAEVKERDLLRKQKRAVKRAQCY